MQVDSQSVVQPSFSESGFSTREASRTGAVQPHCGKPVETTARQQETRKLKETEQKVMVHERAHKSAGGAYAGAVHYEYKKGPDGKFYVVGGEVSIDTSEEKDPEETIRKMRQVRSAALAPADPSQQDLAVAAKASQLEAKARQKLQMEEAAGQDPEGDAPKPSLSLYA